MGRRSTHSTTITSYRQTPAWDPVPIRFAPTDSYGNVLTDSGIPHIENGTVNGTAQFPPGP